MCHPSTDSPAGFAGVREGLTSSQHFVCTQPSATCAFGPPASVLCTLEENVFQTAKEAETFRETGNEGKEEKWEGNRQRLCLVFVHSLKSHSAFPKGLKFSLKTAV